MNPALSPEQWARYLSEGDTGIIGVEHLVPVNKAYAHAEVAIRLHEEEFGFTHADVEALELAEVILFADGGGVDTDPDARKQLDSLSERIAALLPPRST